MLNALFPKAHKRYSSLPILGAIADDFTDWLRAQGYCRGTARLYVRTLPDLDQVFQQQGWGELHALTRQALRACRPAHSQDNRNLAAAVHALERYLEERALLSQPTLTSPSRRDQQLADYRAFLEEVRGLAPSTVRAHLRTVSRLLAQIRFEESPTALTLDDLRWRQGELRVAQRKTGHPLVLPLTDAAGEAVLHYLRAGRPQIASRQLFLRVRAPMGPLKSTAINDAFEACYKRSGLTLPTTGVHGLRHSYALHLLRQGTSLKTIGDLLGHRSPESTCVYLRLDVEDLRQVALELPRTAPAPYAQEEQA